MPPIEVADRFQPMELSDPSLERDHVRNLTFYSPALRGRGDVSLFVPPECDSLSNIPIVILLHGVYGSHWVWFMKGAVHLTALRLIQTRRIRPMLIVSPSDGMRGDGTAYIAHQECDYEAWICKDLVECVRNLFPFTSTDSPVFIAGLSMGGYGALRLGTKHADKFSGISAHSAITRIEQLERFVRNRLELDVLPTEETDILHWMKLNKENLPPLRFDCGTEDALFAANCILHEELQQQCIPHQFVVNNGDHSWIYWQTHVTDTLLFFDKCCSDNPASKAAPLENY